MFLPGNAIIFQLVMVGIPLVLEENDKSVLRAKEKKLRERAHYADGSLSQPNKFILSA